MSRRLHAKVIAWRGKTGSGALAGSANFTRAALDGHNVEASLLLTDAAEMLDSLFDGHLSRRPLAVTDLEPGDMAEPTADGEQPKFRIDTALLADDHSLRVHLSCDLKPLPSAHRLTLRIPGESRPRFSVAVPAHTSFSFTVAVPESTLSDFHETLLASLIGEVGNEPIESPPARVIQQHRLTFEPEDRPCSRKSRVEETVDGLTEYLDEIGNNFGRGAMIEYLRHLNIRFDDGGAFV